MPILIGLDEFMIEFSLATKLLLMIIYFVGASFLLDCEFQMTFICFKCTSLEMKPQSKYIADSRDASGGEKAQLRKACGCHYHYHHHYRHRCRFRSNSCERIEILQRDSGPDSSICRSKSNVEICLYHKKKPSKSRRDATSSEEQASTSEEESGSSEYCHRNYHRRKRDSQRSKEKTKSVASSGRDTVDRAEKSGTEAAKAAATKGTTENGAASNEQDKSMYF